MPSKIRIKLKKKEPVKKATIKAKYGLNKVEKKQVGTLVKKKVNSMAETKYFNTQAGIAKFIPNPVWKSGTTLSEVTCMGFTTGNNEFFSTLSGPNSPPIYYGVGASTGDETEMTPLNLNKVFTSENTNLSRSQQSIVGNSIRPNYNQVQWYLERPTTSSGALNSAPIQVRMIRVKPRAARGSFQPANPKADLFLDQYNEPIGVASTTSGGIPIFGNYEFQMAKVNSRRYKVISDKVFTMSASTSSGANQVTLSSTSGAKRLVTKHNIGKELYYALPNTVDAEDDRNQYPQTGFTPEYVLFHFQTLGQPLTAASRNSTDNINITCRPVSTFKDI